MSINRSITFWLPLIAALLIGWQLGRGYETAKLSSKVDQLNTMLPAGLSGSLMSDSKADVSVIWEAWNLLQRQYIAPDELEGKKLVYGAAEGLVRAVGDPYTVFMPPTETVAFRQSLNGSLEGIGAELKDKDHLITVVNAIEGSPAEKAGLLPEDIIAEVNGESMEGKSLSQAVEKIRGPKGTKVTLLIYRASSTTPVAITITRAAILLPSVTSKIIDTPQGPIGYVDLTQFGDRSMEEVRTALDTFKLRTLKGIVLDLRYNGGGYLGGAIELTSMFLKEGKVVSVERRDVPLETQSVSGDTIYPDIPLVVLVNEGSASASEIVAGALQDNKRATVIGVKSFGKGTVQEVLEMQDGSSLRVTVARWLTPNGKNLGKEGVTPDYVVERTIEQYQANEDPQLDAATAFLATGKVPVKSGTGATSN